MRFRNESTLIRDNLELHQNGMRDIPCKPMKKRRKPGDTGGSPIRGAASYSQRKSGLTLIVGFRQVLRLVQFLCCCCCSRRSIGPYAELRRRRVAVDVINIKLGEFETQYRVWPSLLVAYSLHSIVPRTKRLLRSRFSRETGFHRATVVIPVSQRPNRAPCSRDLVAVLTGVG